MRPGACLWSAVGKRCAGSCGAIWQHSRHDRPCRWWSPTDGPWAGRRRVRAQDRWGLISIDPPYADTRKVGAGSRLARLFSDLGESPDVYEETVAIVHHERRVVLEPSALVGWQLFDRREYGTTAISLLQADGPVTASGESAEPTDGLR